MPEKLTELSRGQYMELLKASLDTTKEMHRYLTIKQGLIENALMRVSMGQNIELVSLELDQRLERAQATNLSQPESFVKERP